MPSTAASCRISQYWRIWKTIPVSRWWSGSPPKFNELFIRPLPTFPDAYLFGSFCAKLLINRQSNNDENISSLAEIMNYIFHDKMNTLAGLCSILYKEEPKEISRWPIQTTPVHLPWFWSTRDWYRHLKDFIDSVSWSADILQSLNGVWHLSSNWDGGTRSASLELLAANYSKNISHWMCQWLVNSEFL